MSESSKVKVTDKRMFTREGELREEYSFLGERARGQDESPTAAPPREPVQAADPVADEPTDAAPERPSVDLPEMPGVGSRPTFFELLSLLAEPAAVYLGDARLPEGESAEDLELARTYIDLLDVLRDKTLGNLTAQESSVLEDLLYRLRTRYVQKRG